MESQTVTEQPNDFGVNLKIESLETYVEPHLTEEALLVFHNRHTNTILELEIDGQRRAFPAQYWGITISREEDEEWDLDAIGEFLAKVFNYLTSEGFTKYGVLAPLLKMDLAKLEGRKDSCMLLMYIFSDRTRQELMEAAHTQYNRGRIRSLCKQSNF